MRRAVVVTGIGAVTPLGVGARILHERWCAGISGIERGEGAASAFEPTEHLSAREVRRADRFTQLALVAGDEATAEVPEEGMDLDYVPGTARRLRIDGRPAVGLSNAFGFGGHNVVLCLEA